MEKEKDKDEIFIKENPNIFKKYRVKKKLGEGAFGDVYMGSSIENNELVAIKVEPRKISKPLLETEAFFLYSLKGLGIPEVLSFGRLKNYNVLIEPLLDRSLFDIFAERRKRLPLEDICLIANQILDRIQWVHSKNIVHRDIKPDNFLIGRKDPNIIYLIDFGLSKKYKSSTTGKHIRFGFTGKLTGTVRFASANALRGGEQSRRDDLESIGYMIIYFMRGKLPWQGVTGNKKMERYLKIYKMKKNVTPEDLCKSLPRQVTEFIRYVKQLEFEQDPDYNYLRNLFNSILKKINETNDQLIFSWIRSSDLPNLKNPINPATRRDSPQSRLYRKIQKNLDNEHKRNNSSDNDSGQNSFQTCTVTMNTNIGIINNNNNNSKDTDIETNPKKLKSKEGLNTMVANLNKTLDEKIVEDFDKPSSNDFGGVSIIPGTGETNNAKKKNYTVNEIINYKNDSKNEGKKQGFSTFSSQKANIKILNEKSEEKNQKSDFEEKKAKIQPINLEENIQKNSNNNNIPNDNDNNNIESNKQNFEDKNNQVPNIDGKIKSIILDNNNKSNNSNENINKSNSNNINNKKGLFNKNSNLYKSINMELNNENDFEPINIIEENIENKNNKNSIYNSVNSLNKENIKENKNINNINIKKSTGNNNNLNSSKTNDALNNNNNYFNENDGEINTDKIDKNKINSKSYNKSIQKIENNEINKFEPNDEQIKDNLLENKKFNKNNNNIIKNLSDKNNNYPNLKDDIQKINHLQRNKNPNLNEINNNNEINNLPKKEHHGNSINKLQEIAQNSNDEGPNDNKRKRQTLRNPNLKSIQLNEKINIQNIGGNNSSKRVNDFNDSLKKKINLNLNNNLNNFNMMNIKLNGRKVQSNRKNNNLYYNNNLGYSKKNTDYIKKVNPQQENLELLPKNSDDIEQNPNKEFFKNIEMKNPNVRKINIVNNYENKLNKLNNNNSNNNTARKGNRNNILQKMRINSNNKNRERNNNIESNNKNKTLPNFNNDLNLNENKNTQKEIIFNPNVKKVIINRTKNMKNINLNKNSFNNNINIMPNDNNDEFNSFPNNLMQMKKYNNNDLNDNMMENNINQNLINMNINNNINNNIIINNSNNNINSNIVRNNSKNNYQGINTANYILNKRPSHNIKNNIHSFNKINPLELNKRPSYNIKSNNNLTYLTEMQIGVGKRPSYNVNFNTSNFLNGNNNNNIPMVGGFTKIKKLNNNNMNYNKQIQLQNNMGENINSPDLRRNFQVYQINSNNYFNQNNTYGESQLMKNNLIKKINIQSPNMNLQPFKNIQNKSPINSQEMFNLSIKKKQMMENRKYYLTEDNPKTRNISSEVKQNQNFIGQFQNINNNNNYINFQNQLNNINLYQNNNFDYKSNFFG